MIMYQNNSLMYVIIVLIALSCNPQTEKKNTIKFINETSKELVRNYKIRVDSFCTEGTDHLNSLKMPELMPNYKGEINIADVKKFMRIGKNKMCFVFIGDTLFNSYLNFNITSQTQDTIFFIFPINKNRPRIWH